MITTHFNRQTISKLTVAVTVFLFLSPASSIGGLTDQAENSIQHLLEYVADSELVFIRNSGQYTAQEASEHMQKKYEHFREKIETPEQFIDLCATRSLLSGKPYLVIDKQGKKIKTSEWLTTELEVYRSNSAGRPH